MPIDPPVILHLADTYTPSTTAVASNLTLTALVGLIPLVVFFVMLAGLRRPALQAGLGALVAAMAVAVVGYGMPAGLTALSACEGIAFGLFPVMWIVVMAIWLYEITVASGRFQDLRRVFNSVGNGDIRVQAMLIAFCFGGMLEALAGFGAPVAITGAMLIALGLPPTRSAVTVLVANTAPVAFGAMAIPITTAGALTGIVPSEIAAHVGRQTPILALFVPLLLLFLVDGRRGVRQAWPVALVTGVVFAAVQFWCSAHFSYELTDVVSSLAGFGAAALMLRFWSPVTPDDQRSKITPEAGVRDATTEPDGSAVIEPSGGTAVRTGLGTSVAVEPALTPARVVLALFPYLLVIVVFGVAKLWKIGVDLPARLESSDLKLHWAGLYGNLHTADGKAASSAVYSLPWLSSPGTLLLISAVIVTVVYSVWTGDGRYPMTLRASGRTLGATVWKMRTAIATVAVVLGLAYVMNQSGQTVAIGTWLAASGTVFSFFSPILGWLGTAVTGSDTSSNALFAKLQQAAGHAAGIDPTLLVASNSSGGVVGKLISPQNLTIAATAVALPGSEPVLARKVLGYSVAMLLVLCVLSFLQSTPVLSWMLP